MGVWVKQEEDTLLPVWLKEGLNNLCPYCGSHMMNYYNDVHRCTNRKCSNDACIGFVAARADFVRKLINLDGVGFATCLQDIKASHATNAFELLHYWNCRPVVSLGLFLRMHCFEGVDNEWETIVTSIGAYTLDELYNSYTGKWKTLLNEHKDEIYNNLQYVKLRERPENLVATGPKLVLNIMITGTPIGYSSKQEFIATLNAVCRGIIVINHQVTKRQSGVHFLIREPGSTTRGKVDAARKGGIPIVTSEEFINYLTAQMQAIVSESNK